MTNSEFEVIKNKLKEYQYTSMNYIEYEDIYEYEFRENNENVIFLFGFNQESKKNELHWAGNCAKDLLRSIEGQSDVLISFIPREWVDDFRKHGFEVYAVWNDYFLPEIKVTEYIMEPEFLTENECNNASEVTLACCGQSRGFSGQTTGWMKQWIQGKSPAVPEYTKNCAVLIHRTEGKLTGVLCTGTYAHDSEKGAVLWIREVAVHPDFQRRGIARELIQQALTYGFKHGAKRAFLMADECNENAIHLYESFGFQGKKDDAQIDMIKI